MEDRRMCSLVFHADLDEATSVSLTLRSVHNEFTFHQAKHGEGQQMGCRLGNGASLKMDGLGVARLASGSAQRSGRRCLEDRRTAVGNSSWFLQRRFRKINYIPVLLYR
jgi:hypothetical protein